MKVVSYTITIGAPAVLNGKEGRRDLAAFYCALLDMRVIREDWLKIAKDAGALPQIALDGDGWSDERPPRWPDPEFPQQMHLDILVNDPAGADRHVLKLGARRLQHGAGYRSYEDPAGHPFCLYADERPDGSRSRVGRIVFDCFSPRSLASFYEGLLGSCSRLEDSPERVVIAPEGLPMFAFQHAQFVPARWPDPRYPAQLHLDLNFDEGDVFEHAERLGAVPLLRPDGSEGVNGMGRPMRTYADPAGHPFCIGAFA